MRPAVASSRTLGASFVLVLVWLAAVPVIPVGAALQPISRVREMARVAPGTRVTIRGVVTRYRPGRSLAVQDQSGGIFVYTEGETMLVPGDIVEVTGVADVDEERAPCIDKASYQKVGTADPPHPIAVAATELAQGRHEADLVTVDGTVVRVETGRYEYGIVARAGEIEFTSWVLRDQAGTVPSLPPGQPGPDHGRGLAHDADRRPAAIRAADADRRRRGRPGAGLVVDAEARVHGGDDARRDRRAAPLVRAAPAPPGRAADRRDPRAAAGGIRAHGTVPAGAEDGSGRTLAGGIAHDFNNIMTVVLGHSEILALELKDHPEMRTSVAEIQNAAERAAALTRQLLAFGRRQTLASSPVDLNDVARNMVSLLARARRTDRGPRRYGGRPGHGDDGSRPAGAGAAEPRRQRARCDAGRRPPGCVVGRATRRAPGAAGVGVLTVADTGTGILPEVQPHIFDPFFTTKEVGRGSGLGLAMVYGFVQQSGGTIRFDSAIGAGTTFELTPSRFKPAENNTC